MRQKNEILAVSFGTTSKDGRKRDIKGIEDALKKAYPKWLVCRAFTSQTIINRIQKYDGEKIDNIEKALDRAYANGVKNIIVQPTHLMRGTEYEEMVKTIDKYACKFENLIVADPLICKESDIIIVAKSITEQIVIDSDYESVHDALLDGTAFVFMGHGSNHISNSIYTKMQSCMEKLGFDNVFLGTAMGAPRGTSCKEIIEKVKRMGYTKVILSPLMVTAGLHVKNDMAGDDENSWKSQLIKSDLKVKTLISGLGSVKGIQELYVAHTAAAMDRINIGKNQNS